jgi:type VI secretion system secreted protein Hcp
MANTKNITIKNFLVPLAISATVLSVLFISPNPNSPTPVAGAAAVDYFLKIEGVAGESTDPTYPSTIEIDSFSWGLSNSGSMASGGGGGSGKVSFQDLHFTMKRIDKSSPQLRQALAQGQHFPKATLFVRKTGGNPEEFYKVALSDVVVSSYQSSASGGDVPKDNFSLNFTKIEFEYKPQSQAGTTGDAIKFSWDLKKSTK